MLFPVLLSNLQRLSTAFEKKKNTQSAVFISILSDFNRARDVAKRPGDVCSATTEAERRPRTFEPRRDSKTRKGYPFGYPFLVPLRARDVAKRPGDVCSATTEAERRPRTFEPRRGSKTRKRISSRISFSCSFESARRDSNPRPRPWQGRAPPTEPLAHILLYLQVLMSYGQLV